ncbi:MAG: VOC family protein [Ectothiorhodospiraceae bacterium]|nr:VOC family protein [Ectothiorhodospiraceae bacterium]
MDNQTGTIIPHLVVNDAAAAIAFYSQALGAVEIMRVPADDGQRLMHAALEINGATLYLRDDFPDACPTGDGEPSTPQALGGSPVTMHLPVADCDAAVERASRAGATVLMPPEDAFWGDRFAVVVDPYGHYWSFAHPLEGQT